ncbi:MAG: hypothetical protein IPK62_11760 [Bacteroidetes bacterium]|nr:hypothetical protein [Bacteroidota bacterium]MBK8145611.1 hypothetical protein [Bacteroidota bacterium]MBP6315593.1 hypothetical protein [Chitinophagaceae bacterium]
MATYSVVLIVDVDTLKRLSQENKLGTDNSWATIKINNGTPITNPKDYVITVHKDDVITWSGEALPSSDSGPQPVINITYIDFKTNEDKFSSKKQHLPIAGGATYEATANTILDAVSYNIDFIISYKHRILDPKIKVIPKP